MEGINTKNAGGLKMKIYTNDSNLIENKINKKYQFKKKIYITVTLT